MIYPELDKTLMPYMVLPVTPEQEETKKHLGYKAVTGSRAFDVEFIAVDGMVSETMQALYAFWRDDCNYGTKPFLISLPFFGSSIDDVNPNFLVKFRGKMSAPFNTTWSMKRRLEVIGEVNHTGDAIIPENIQITWEKDI